MGSLSSEELQRLGENLLEDPSSNMNNILPLLKALNTQQPKDSAIAAVRGLKVYFSDAFEKGDLRTCTAKTDQEDPQSVYRAWLSRQHSSFIANLLQLLITGADPAVQVAAVAALMEGVRGCEGSGRFNNHMYERLFEALLGNSGVASEALSYLITQFLSYADVRFYTLRVVAKFAEAGLAGTSADAGDLEASQTADEQRRQSGANAEASQKVALPDLARSAYDVLARIPHGFTNSIGDDKAETEEGMSSWCGSLAAAANGGESSQKRRKRKRQQVANEGTAADGEDVKAVKWANPVLLRRAWSKAWLALLRLPLPQDILKKVLVRMHVDIIPHLTNPHLLTDFLTAALDAGGLHGILALHGIFTLVTKHGLEYPHFYRRLYNLLTPAALMESSYVGAEAGPNNKAKHRALFFQLVDVFLSSSGVPAYTVAAFAKRFARLALMSSPAGAMIAIVFVHNLLRRHPSCNILLHKPLPAGAASNATSAPQQNGSAGPHASGSSQAAEKSHDGNGQGGKNGSAEHELDANRKEDSAGTLQLLGQDPYNFAEENPAESRAIDSSLWELDSLRNHYCPQVAAFAMALDKDLTDKKKTSEIDPAPLLTGSYSSMISAELGRRLKHVPVAFYPRKITGLMDPEACRADFVGWAF